MSLKFLFQYTPTIIHRPPGYLLTPMDLNYTINPLLSPIDPWRSISTNLRITDLNKVEIASSFNNRFAIARSKTQNSAIHIKTTWKCDQFIGEPDFRCKEVRYFS